MKQPIDFPPHIKISDWMKQLIVDMMTIDEAKRIGIKQVLEIIQKNSKDMDIEWFKYVLESWISWKIKQM